MKGIVDRFEENYAVVETEDYKYINIDKKKLPSNCKEGDVLIMSSNGIIIDKEETRKRKEAIEEIMNNLG